MVFIRRNEGYWRKYVTVARTGLIIVCGVALLVVLVSVAPYIADNPSNYASANQQNGGSSIDDNLSILAVIGNGSVAFGRWAGFHHNAIEALSALGGLLFSCVLTFSTIFLWLETRNAARAGAEQAKLTRESVDLGNKEFISSHRPRIVLRGINAIIQDPKNGLVVIRFNVHNTGSSKATITDIKFRASGRIKDTFYFPVVMLNLPNLPHDVEAGFDFEAIAGSGSDWASIIQNGLSCVDAGYSAAAIQFDNIYLNFRITIFYQDILGGRRQTSVHRDFDFFERRFTKIADSEFEYQD